MHVIWGYVPPGVALLSELFGWSIDQICGANGYLIGIVCSRGYSGCRKSVLLFTYQENGNIQSQYPAA
ncbi:hypothetical protein D9619_008530 [Psilocybe cf. subviscida]|uniref:Uncharacterized protein n=1 Tax=Psilocybe cf. subviscida TaxID=2480587 RepID=A0A8H5B9L6_9AGAR|nr:hypothetical protein D9619_008530 [Psilocybe cf. subviscida]